MANEKMMKSDSSASDRVCSFCGEQDVDVVAADSVVHNVMVTICQFCAILALDLLKAREENKTPPRG